MKKLILILFLFPLLMANTCEDDRYEDYPCTAEARAGLNVSVSLGSQNSITSDGVTVVATHGNYTETLVAYNENDPIFSGAYERRGNYIITVSKEGYQTYTSGLVMVKRDECHVIPKFVHVSLQPNP
ncbi:MAG TPA: hypothetical protein VK476_04000 [Flavobacterium sp.]|nr:hypothetical protein [Flavobacterium sp.]